VTDIPLVAFSDGRRLLLELTSEDYSPDAVKIATGIPKARGVSLESYRSW
jgi:hypothetical protein